MKKRGKRKSVARAKSSKASRMKVRKEIMAKGVKLNPKLILLSVFAGLLYYPAYLFNVPNSYSLIVTLIFLIFLVKGFNKAHTTSVLIYSMMYNAVALPMTILALPLSWYSMIAVLLLNWALILLVISGLKQMKLWGFGIMAFLTMISFANLLILLTLVFSQPFVLNIFSSVFLAKSVVSLAFVIGSMAYLVNSARRGFFK